MKYKLIWGVQVQCYEFWDTDDIRYFWSFWQESRGKEQLKGVLYPCSS